ncbi:MAG: CHAT domain-containing protein [Leptolyngbyaceae bacterium]|nr:CHAT domain-containing protein [Leptolyngbyaceae bacterium]
MNSERRGWRAFLSVLSSKLWLFLGALFCVIFLHPAIAIESSLAYFSQETGDASTEVIINISDDSGLTEATNATSLLQQGQRFYDAGQFRQAIETWESARDSAQQTNDLTHYVASLNYLAMTYRAIGDWDAATQAIHQSLDHFQSIEISSQRDDWPLGPSLYAQSLNILGELQLSMGQAEEAIASWERSEVAYQRDQDYWGAIGSRMNQAQALQDLGHYRQAQMLLEDVATELQQQPESALKALSLINLGSILQVVGNLEEARDLLTQGITLAQTFQSDDERSVALLNLGTIYQTLGDIEHAHQSYEEAARSTSNPTRQVEAYLNLFKLAIAQKEWESAETLATLIQAQLNNLSPSRMSVYAQVNFAATVLTLSSETASSPNTPPESLQFVSNLEIAEILSQAVLQSRQLNDSQAESYALGELWNVYEESGEYDWAYHLTQQALTISQSVNAPHISYRWQWQLGRIQVKQAKLESSPSDGKMREAIAAYSEAVNTLKFVNRDLLSTNSEFQFSFRENIEPVYRELADLLLQPGATPDDLNQARTVLEDLQLAELENFFRSSCLDATVQRIDDLDSNGAVVYPVIFSDRIEVILSVPGESLQQYTTFIPQEDVDAALEQLLQSMNPAFSDRLRLSLSQQLYDWLIRPLESTLSQHHIERLIFVLDGVLRNVPMASLYDGEHYLIETYGIALAPGLQLVAPQLPNDQIPQVLTAGISEARQGFSALPGVAAEIEEISQTFPSRTILNEAFTRQNIENQLVSANFSIVHLATHGQFSSDPEQTFLLSWDDQIKVGEFENLVRSRQSEDSRPIELLVLSACQTATGDKQAALGLAGFAVRAGARSTLATLWAVNDTSTAFFMTRFYQLLNEHPEASKSSLVREAQLSLIQHPDYNHPFYWAPFVIVGNWL